jgi:phage gp16-like protein
MSAPARRSYNQDAERLRLIKLLHVAKRDLRMVDADYRAVLGTASGGKKTSSSDLSIQELEKAVSHMKRCGFKVRTKKPGGARQQPSRALARDPESTKIRALWLFLHQLGAVENPSEAALAAYVKRITKVDDLHWISGYQAETLIESLKKWAMRYLPGAVKDLVPAVQALDLDADTAGQLNVVMNRAFTRGTFDPMQDAWQALTDVLRSNG